MWKHEFTLDRRSNSRPCRKLKKKTRKSFSWKPTAHSMGDLVNKFEQVWEWVPKCTGQMGKRRGNWDLGGHVCFNRSGDPQVNKFEQVYVITHREPHLLWTDTQIQLKILPSRSVAGGKNRLFQMFKDHFLCNKDLVKRTISLFKYLGPKNMIFELYKWLAGIKIDFVVQKRFVIALVGQWVMYLSTIRCLISVQVSCGFCLVYRRTSR